MAAVARNKRHVQRHASLRSPSPRIQACRRLPPPFTPPRRPAREEKRRGRKERFQMRERHPVHVVMESKQGVNEIGRAYKARKGQVSCFIVYPPRYFTTNKEHHTGRKMHRGPTPSHGVHVLSCPSAHHVHAPQCTPSLPASILPPSSIFPVLLLPRVLFSVPVFRNQRYREEDLSHYVVREITER